jgi:hypothetical protein
MTPCYYISPFWSNYLLPPFPQVFRTNFTASVIPDSFKQYCRNYFSFLADRADEIIERLILSVNTGRTEPTGYGSSAFGEDDSGNENSKSPSRALVKHITKSYHQNLPAIGKNPFAMHRLSFPYAFCFATKHIGKNEPFLFANSVFKELRYH